jgi:hypothetical protein
MKPHRLDAVSLAFGAVFLLIAGWWLIGQRIDLGLPQLGWLVALGLIGLGALGLIGALRNRQPARSTSEQPPPWPDEQD